MSQQKRLWLICYDISVMEGPVRLNRVARYLQKVACRVQYSVFVGQFTDRKLDVVLQELSAIIDPKMDDVRCYPLPEQADVVLMGQQLFPDDILLIRDGHNLLRLGEGVVRNRDKGEEKVDVEDD